MKIITFILLCVLISCTTKPNKEKKELIEEVPVVYTKYSEGKKQYVNFQSNNAINKIADIENEYFRTIEKGVSQYYGTVWREKAENIILPNDTTQYIDYLNNLPTEITKPDSLHCTLYAYEGLKAGLNVAQLNQLEKYHKDIWKSREIAGWSVGYILVKYFNWEAYLILDSNSSEFDHCMKSFRKDKTYPVWKQPNIPLKEVFIIGEQDALINDLLLQYEFGWGFSEQGIHTWITRFDELKECNWLGAPAKKYQSSEWEKPLFISTEFSKYFDYQSHVIVFPASKN